MTAGFRKPRLLHSSRATLTLPLPMPFTARVRTPPRAANRSSAADTREYRRTVRAAELAVWEAAAPSAAAQLRPRTAAATKDSPAEERWFAVLMALALVGIVWGLADALRVVERRPHFVASVRQNAVAGETPAVDLSGGVAANCAALTPSHAAERTQ